MNKFNQPARRTSIILTAEDDGMIAFLKDRGFGNNSNIIREALKRFAEQEARKVEYIPAK